MNASFSSNTSQLSQFFSCLEGILMGKNGGTPYRHHPLNRTHYSRRSSCFTLDWSNRLSCGWTYRPLLSEKAEKMMTTLILLKIGSSVLFGLSFYAAWCSSRSMDYYHYCKSQNDIGPFPTSILANQRLQRRLLTRILVQILPV